MKLIIKKNRSKLAEGRSSGMSFAFVKKLKTAYSEIMPLSACKDFLNDALYGEITNKKTPVIYGFSHTPRKILNDDFIYLSVGELTSNKETPGVKVNVSNSLHFINDLEEKLEITKTELIQNNPYDILKIDKYWAQYPYLISAYTLMFRETNKKKYTIDTYTSGIYDNLDKNTLIKIKSLINKSTVPFQDINLSITKIHEGGIKNFKI